MPSSRVLLSQTGTAKANKRVQFGYFRWDKRRGVYICPANKVLHTSGTVHDGRTLFYRASKLDCDVCELSTLSSGGANTISTGVFRLVESLIRKFYQIENGIHGRTSFHNSNADRCSDGV